MRPRTSKCAPSRSASELAAPDLSSSASRSACPRRRSLSRSGTPSSTRCSLRSPSFPTVILAVSGGADSVAMMHLARALVAAACARTRSSSSPRSIMDCARNPRNEAEWVAREARALGLAHETLTWDGCQAFDRHPGRRARGALPAARRAGAHCRSAVPAAIVTAHTEDDQAETLLMRLARGSGLDGLTAMAEQRAHRRAGCVLLRPLLGVSGRASACNAAAPRSALGSKIRATMPSASSACACARRGRCSPGLGLDQRQDRAQRPPSRARAGGTRCRRRAPCSKPRASICTAAPLPASTRATLVGSARGAAPASPWRVSLRLTAARTEPLRLVPARGACRPAGRAGVSKAPRSPALSSRATGTTSASCASRGGKRCRRSRCNPAPPPCGTGAFASRAAADAGGPVEVRALGLQAFADLRQQLEMPRGLPAQRRRDAARLLARRPT